MKLLAWLLDLRGNDVACTPVFLGFLLLTKEDAVLCARAGAAKHLADLCAVTSCPVRPETVEEQKCMADWILLPLLCRPEAAPLRELAGAKS